MSDKLKLNTPQDESMIYQIRIQGHLSPQWSSWFDGMTIKLEDNGDTILTGPVIDQAALHGLLRKVRDTGMSLIFVKQINHDLTKESENKQ